MSPPGPVATGSVHAQHGRGGKGGVGSAATACDMRMPAALAVGWLVATIAGAASAGG